MNRAGTHAAILSALSLALASCGGQAGNEASNALNGAGNSISNASDAVGNTIENVAQDLTPTPSPKEFADTAARSDAFEIAAAGIAKTNAASSAVKDFAAMMVDAHSQSTAKIKKAAAAGTPPVTPDPKLTDKQESDLADLRKLNGADFDKAYVDGQIEAHEDALSLMKKYAADGTDASLKAVAGEIAPVVQTHLDSARALKGH